jgi:hypothetical protein
MSPIRHPSAWSGTLQQEMQCTYNVIMRRDRAAIVAVEKQEVFQILSVCARSHSY